MVFIFLSLSKKLKIISFVEDDMTELQKYNADTLKLCCDIAALKKRIDREDRLIAQTLEVEFSEANRELKGVLLRKSYERKQRFVVELCGLLGELEWR